MKEPGAAEVSRSPWTRLRTTGAPIPFSIGPGTLECLIVFSNADEVVRWFGEVPYLPQLLG